MSIINLKFSAAAAAAAAAAGEEIERPNGRTGGDEAAGDGSLRPLRRTRSPRRQTARFGELVGVFTEPTGPTSDGAVSIWIEPASHRRGREKREERRARLK